jgi:hypothetical protein
MAGITHGFQQERAKAQMKWPAALQPGLLTFIGVCEILGGVGVILPALSGILSWLTPLGAAGLALVMLLAAGFHVMRREYRNAVFNLVLLALCAFVAYGRWVIAPL